MKDTYTKSLQMTDRRDVRWPPLSKVIGDLLVGHLHTRELSATLRIPQKHRTCLKSDIGLLYFGRVKKVGGAVEKRGEKPTRLA